MKPDTLVACSLATLAGFVSVFCGLLILNHGLPGPLGFSCFIHGCIAGSLPTLRCLWGVPRKSDEVVAEPRVALKAAMAVEEQRSPPQMTPPARLQSEAYPIGEGASTPAAAPAQASADAESHAESPLVASAALFAACMLGDDDVDVTQFMHACREYTQVLALLGTSTKLAAREVHGNLAKIDKHYKLDPERFASMRTLLVDEMKTRKHSADAGLYDSSAAVGLLWARRGLRYWLAAFAPLIAFGVDDVCGDAWGSGEAGPKAQSGYDTAMAAYAASLQPFNGFASNRLFKLAARAQPKWSQMGPKLADSPEALRSGMVAWSDALGSLLDRMAKLQTELNLEDMRRGM